MSSTRYDAFYGAWRVGPALAMASLGFSLIAYRPREPIASLHDQMPSPVSACSRPSRHSTDCESSHHRGEVSCVALWLLLWADRARASCDRSPAQPIPSGGCWGASTGPFAGPGDFVELRLSPTCDAASPGFDRDPSGNVVTVAFTPSAGPAHLVVIAADCNAMESERASCAANLAGGDGGVSSPDDAVEAARRSRWSSAESLRLRFRFPIPLEWCPGPGPCS